MPAPTQNEGIGDQVQEPRSNENGGGEEEPEPTGPSTRTEDDVLNSIQELRSQYIYQYRPGLRFDISEQFGILRPAAPNPNGAPGNPQLPSLLTSAAPSELSERIRALRLASEQST